MKCLYFVDATQGCYSLVAVDNIVIEASPDINWTIGKTIDYVKKFFIDHRCEFTASKINSRR